MRSALSLIVGIVLGAIAALEIESRFVRHERNGMPPATAPNETGLIALEMEIPSIEGKKIIRELPDGSVEFEGGVRYYRNTNTMQWEAGGLQFTDVRGASKTIVRAIPEPKK